jgi:aminoglycoside phosphotransferase (APT) family kinase protein
MAKINPEKNRFIFRHGDMHAGNMNVKDGKINGIFDWEHSRFEPLFQNCE